MSNAGWVKLHRQCIENGWLQNPKLWAFWCYCLLKATHKPITQQVGYQRVDLEPGQFIFGRLQAAKDLKQSVQNIRTEIDTLKSTLNLTIKTTNKYSVITIVNWHTYQDNEVATNHQTNHQTNQQLTNNSPQTRSKEVKEVKTLVHFETFWSAYPKKKGKVSAQKAWVKISLKENTLEKILSSLEWQTKQSDWLKDDGQFIPLPASWLNGQRWLDEPPVASQVLAPAHQVQQRDRETEQQLADLRRMGVAC